MNRDTKDSRKRVTELTNPSNDPIHRRRIPGTDHINRDHRLEEVIPARVVVTADGVNCHHAFFPRYTPISILPPFPSPQNQHPAAKEIKNRKGIETYDSVSYTVTA